MVTVRIEAGDIAKAVIVILLLASPFVFFWLGWSLFAPIGFWQAFATFAIIGLICFVEGAVAWTFAIALIVV